MDRQSVNLPSRATHFEQAPQNVSIIYLPSMEAELGHYGFGTSAQNSFFAVHRIVSNANRLPQLFSPQAIYQW